MKDNRINLQGNLQFYNIRVPHNVFSKIDLRNQTVNLICKKLLAFNDD